MKEFTIGQNDAGQRLDKFLGKAVPLLPSSMMYKGIRTKRIKVNSKRAEISTRLAVGDVVSLYLNDEFFEEKRADEAFLRAGDALSVIYEDENILIADKPAGLVVHEDESGTADTLIGRVQKYLYQKGEYDPAQENSFAPALCNRIDRNTCGLVLCAKNAAALQAMNEIIKERQVKKTYRCVTVGVPKPDHATCKAFLRRDTKTKTVTVFDKPQPDAKTILTEYRVLRQKNGLHSAHRPHPSNTSTYDPHGLAAAGGYQVLHTGKSEEKPGIKIAAAGAVCLAAALYRHFGGLPLILPKRTGVYRQEVAGRLGEVVVKALPRKIFPGRALISAMVIRFPGRRWWRRR